MSLISSLYCDSCVMDCSGEKLASSAIAQFLPGMLETLKEQQQQMWFGGDGKDKLVNIYPLAFSLWNGP